LVEKLLKAQDSKLSDTV